ASVVENVEEANRARRIGLYREHTRISNWLIRRIPKRAADGPGVGVAAESEHLKVDGRHLTIGDRDRHARDTRDCAERVEADGGAVGYLDSVSLDHVAPRRDTADAVVALVIRQRGGRRDRTRPGPRAAEVDGCTRANGLAVVTPCHPPPDLRAAEL